MTFAEALQIHQQNQADDVTIKPSTRHDRERAEHIKRAVGMGKRGYERIERMWDENAFVEVRDESLAAATRDKHDTIIRPNLGINETRDGSGALNLNVLAGRGGWTLLAIEQQPIQTPAQGQA